MLGNVLLIIYSLGVIFPTANMRILVINAFVPDTVQVVVEWRATRGELMAVKLLIHVSQEPSPCPLLQPGLVGEIPHGMVLGLH